MPAATRVWPWVTSLALLGCVALGLGVYTASVREELAKAEAHLQTLSAANGELEHSSQELNASVKEMSATLAALTSPPNANAIASASTAVRSDVVPYGEVPFDRGRLEALRDTVSKLEAQGFHGVVKLTSMAGVFCLAGNVTDGYMPAAPALFANKCDVLGNPFEESLSSQQRQSLAFANLVSSIRQRTGGAITVLIENAASPRPAVAYPTRSDMLTAGDWNKAAAANNRVEMQVEPAQ